MEQEAALQAAISEQEREEIALKALDKGDETEIERVEECPVMAAA